MKNYILSFFAAMAIALSAMAQNTSKIYQYTPGDGGILYTMTRGNKWAIINLGTSASGGNASSQLFDMESGEHFPVTFKNHDLPFAMASNDGNIIVGHYGDYAYSFNRETNVIHSYPNRPLWKNGQLVDCTPDGKYAVGYYEGYLGKSDNSDIPNDWFYRTLFVDVEKGDTIYTPNLPTRNRMGQKYQSIKFNRITPDGRYIMGAVDWYIDGGFNFIYDTKEQKTLTNTSLMQLYGGDVASRYPNVVSCSGSMQSPNGNAIGGRANIRVTGEDGVVATESVPCVYFRDRDELVVYADAEEGNVGIEAMDDAGTFFGCTETGTPLRDFKILYNGKYWVTLNQICRQRYGYNFYERTGYERTGTIMGVSGDGHKLISFHDPMGESYCFDFGESVEEACSGLDLLGTYAITPESNTEFAKISSVEVRFERPVQIIGSGKNVHLYDSQGKLVCDGLSSTSGLTHKTGSKNTVVANFRTRMLTPGERYTVVIDAGSIATAKDKTFTNREIRVEYIGRANEPVRFLSSVPKDGESIQKIDNESSYIILTFDSKVKLTETAEAYVERVADGTRASSLTMVAGTDTQTKNKVLLYPPNTVNLYADQDYRVVVEPNSISDYTGDEASYNERIVITLHGSFVRTVPTGDVLFSDSWDNIVESLQMWLRYDGDHNTPLASMQQWEFDAENQPWNFSIRESNDTYDYCAASHSLYAPSGQSDDWMMTPQITLPAEGKCTIEFDAQSYMPNKADTLEVYVYEQEFVLSYLNQSIMEYVKKDAKLVFKEVLSAGESQENLSGDWTHYSIDLTPWGGKDVYIAFVNHNRNQSAIFIDNVSVNREVLYQLALDFEERIVAHAELPITGKITIKKDGVSNVSLILNDNEGNEVSRIEWKDISGNMKDRTIPFSFATPLPLETGKVNKYSIAVQIDERTDTYHGTITNLAFQPTKRVVLEEMTGVDCPNCPQGIVAIEKMEETFGDRFIPVSIHTYTGDPYESGLSAYSTYLGLNGAPSARINRTNGIYFPMVSNGGTFSMTNASSPLWYDIVSKLLDEPALCDFSVTASTDGNTIDCKAEVNYAITADGQQLSVLLIVLEDSLTNYQSNAFGTIEQSLFGEWGKGGIYSAENSNGYAYPVIHNDVARSVIGTTLGGTIGIFPTSFKAGESYTASITAPFPSTVVIPANAHIVALLINSQSGEVVNAANSPIVRNPNANSITENKTTDELHSIYTITGVRIKASQMKKGSLYIFNNKKVLY